MPPYKRFSIRKVPKRNWLAKDIAARRILSFMRASRDVRRRIGLDPRAGLAKPVRAYRRKVYNDYRRKYDYTHRRYNR